VLANTLALNEVVWISRREAPQAHPNPIEHHRTKRIQTTALVWTALDFSEGFAVSSQAKQQGIVRHRRLKREENKLWEK
jgi:hypothetical protein